MPSGKELLVFNPLAKILIIEVTIDKVNAVKISQTATITLAGAGHLFAGPSF